MISPRQRLVVHVSVRVEPASPEDGEALRVQAGTGPPPPVVTVDDAKLLFDLRVRGGMSLRENHGSAENEKRVLEQI